MATDGRASDIDDDELALIVGRYALGTLTLGQAAERADVSRWRKSEILREAGVELRVGPEDQAAAEEDVETALDLE